MPPQLRSTADTLKAGRARALRLDAFLASPGLACRAYRWTACAFRGQRFGAFGLACVFTGAMGAVDLDGEDLFRAEDGPPMNRSRGSRRLVGYPSFNSALAHLHGRVASEIAQSDDRSAHALLNARWLVMAALRGRASVPVYH